ncbi:protein kinase domain protein, partial [Ichthyophthirius multifiliis]
MVDKQGYLKLIDLGSAKIMQNNSGFLQRTFTLIGTPHYMAPEIISGQGYSYPVDIWSMGIILYEFMCGQVPFGEECEDPYEIYEYIVRKDISFPSYMEDQQGQKLIRQFLNKVPEIRLGGSYYILKNNEWFKNFDW